MSPIHSQRWPSLKTGFTLIELVAVIVIVGTLSAVALPRFIDLQGEARGAALESVRGAAAQAHANNLAAARAGSNDAISFNDCRNTAKLLQRNLRGYKFKGPGTSGPRGTGLPCEVEQKETGDTLSFTGFLVP